MLPKIQLQFGLGVDAVKLPLREAVDAIGANRIGRLERLYNEDGDWMFISWRAEGNRLRLGTAGQSTALVFEIKAWTGAHTFTVGDLVSVADWLAPLCERCEAKLTEDDAGGPLCVGCCDEAHNRQAMTGYY